MKKFTKTLLIGLFASAGISGVANAQLTLFKDLAPGTLSATPSNFVDVNGTMFFSTTNTSTYKGAVLWKSDGTPGNTVPIDTIPATSSSANVSSFVNVNGTLFFIFDPNPNFNQDELWKSDGTKGGTMKVKSLGTRYTTNLTAIGNKLFFIASTGLNSSGGDADYELWVSDGLAAGTMKIELNKKGNGYAEGPLTVYKGKVYFTGRDSSVTKNRAYTSDGTVAGTVPSFWNGNGIIFNNDIYYYGSTDNVNYGIMKSDGSNAGTMVSVGTFLSPKIFNNEIYFARGVYDLWKTDGTTGGTKLVESAAGYIIEGATSDALYSRNLAQELFKTSATTTAKFTSKHVSTANGAHAFLGNKMYWLGLDTVAPPQYQSYIRVFETDGTDAGTKFYSGQFVYEIFLFKNTLFISASSGKGQTSGNVELYTLGSGATGINESNALDLNFHVFPNPSNGNFVVEDQRLDNQNTKVELSVYNLLGEVVFSTTLTHMSETLNLSGQPAGLYFVQLQAGKEFSCKKIVIK